MCSLNLEHTGDIIQLSFWELILELEQFTLPWVLIIGDLLLLIIKYFFDEGAGDLKALLPFDIGVYVALLFDLWYPCDLPS